jgi:hypothetical protein
MSANRDLEQVRPGVACLTVGPKSSAVKPSEHMGDGSAKQENGRNGANWKTIRNENSKKRTEKESVKI